MIRKNSSARRYLEFGALCRYLFSALIISIFVPAVLLSQSEIKISGRVIDDLSGGPVSGAIVVLVDCGRTAISDLNGDFRFSDIPSGRYDLIAKRIGYRPSGDLEISVESYSAASLIIRLTPDPFETDDQLVTASKNGPVSIKRRNNVTIIEIDNGANFKIEDLTAELPELEIINFGSQKLLRLRGSNPNGTEIKLNGRKINSVLSSTGDISSIPFGSVRAIEIVTGGNYENSGLSGSVNFITSDPGREYELSTRTERSSFGGELYTGRLSGPAFHNIIFNIDLENIFDRGDFSFTDPRDSVQTRENNQYHDRKIFGALKTDFVNGSLEFDARYFKRNSGSPGPIFQLTPQAKSDIEEKELTFRYSKDVNEMSGFSLNGGITNRVIAYDSPRTIFNFIAYKSEFKETGRDLTAGYQYKGDFDFDLSSIIRYESLTGIDYIRPEASFGRHTRLTNSVQAGVAYHLPKIDILKNLTTLSTGIRREGGFGGDFNAPSATLRAVFDIFASPGFDISYSRSRRLPDLTDLFWKEDVFAEPNPGLKSEISEGYEIGFDIEFTGGLSSKFRAARYYREYDDLIIWRRWGGNRFKPVNLSKAEISGWEYSLDCNPYSGPVSVFWSGSFNRPINRESEINHYGKYLTFRQIGSQSAGLKLNTGGLEVKISGRHLGRRYQTEENTKSLPPVDLLDLRIRYSLKIQKLNISAGIEISNISDKRYEILERQPERPREIGFELAIMNIEGLL